MTPSCEDCRGACCEDPVRLAGWERVLPWVRAWLRVRGPGGACQHLVDGRCGIYEERPLVCRAYEVGGAACLEVRARRRG